MGMVQMGVVERWVVVEMGMVIMVERDGEEDGGGDGMGVVEMGMVQRMAQRWWWGWMEMAEMLMV